MWEMQEKHEEMDNRKEGGAKNVQGCVGNHEDDGVAWTQLSLDKFRWQTEEKRKVVVVGGGAAGRGKTDVERGRMKLESVAWRWHFDINLAGSRKTAAPAHHKYENTAQREGGRGEDEGMRK